MKFLKLTALFLVLTMMSCEKESATADASVSEIDAAYIEDFLDRIDLVGVKELRIGDEVYFMDKIKDPKVLDKIEAIAMTDNIHEEMIDEGITRLSIPTEENFKAPPISPKWARMTYKIGKRHKSVSILRGGITKRFTRQAPHGVKQIWVFKHKSGILEALIKKNEIRLPKRIKFARNKPLRGKRFTPKHFSKKGRDILGVRYLK